MCDKANKQPVHGDDDDSNKAAIDAFMLANYAAASLPRSLGAVDRDDSCNSDNYFSYLQFIRNKFANSRTDSEQILEQWKSDFADSNQTTNTATAAATTAASSNNHTVVERHAGHENKSLQRTDTAAKTTATTATATVDVDDIEDIDLNAPLSVALEVIEGDETSENNYENAAADTYSLAKVDNFVEEQALHQLGVNDNGDEFISAGGYMPSGMRLTRAAATTATTATAVSIAATIEKVITTSLAATTAAAAVTNAGEAITSTTSLLSNQQVSKSSAAATAVFFDEGPVQSIETESLLLPPIPPTVAVIQFNQEAVAVPTVVAASPATVNSLAEEVQQQQQLLNEFLRDFANDESNNVATLALEIPQPQQNQNKQQQQQQYELPPRSAVRNSHQYDSGDIETLCFSDSDVDSDSCSSSLVSPITSSDAITPTTPVRPALSAGVAASAIDDIAAAAVAAGEVDMNSMAAALSELQKLSNRYDGIDIAAITAATAAVNNNSIDYNDPRQTRSYEDVLQFSDDEC